MLIEKCLLYVSNSCAGRGIHVWHKYSTINRALQTGLIDTKAAPALNLLTSSQMQMSSKASPPPPKIESDFERRLNQPTTEKEMKVIYGTIPMGWPNMEKAEKKSENNMEKVEKKSENVEKVETMSPNKSELPKKETAAAARSIFNPQASDRKDLHEMSNFDNQLGVWPPPNKSALWGKEAKVEEEVSPLFKSLFQAAMGKPKKLEEKKKEADVQIVQKIEWPNVKRVPGPMSIKWRKMRIEDDLDQFKTDFEENLNVMKTHRNAMYEAEMMAEGMNKLMKLVLAEEKSPELANHKQVVLNSLLDYFKIKRDKLQRELEMNIEEAKQFSPKLAELQTAVNKLKVEMRQRSACGPFKKARADRLRWRIETRFDACEMGLKEREGKAKEFGLKLDAMMKKVEQLRKDVKMRKSWMP